MKKVFLAYPHYWPHYKVGGPLQSLFNLVNQFRGEASFYLVSLNRDIDGTLPDEELPLNEWRAGINNEHVFYTSGISFFLMKKLLVEIQPDVIFINGMFNLSTTLPSLVLGKQMRIPIIISPRGMLQHWALQRSKFKKKIFLFLLKKVLSRIEVWHATDEQERQDIKTHFGEDQVVYIASNIPKTLVPLKEIPFPSPDGKIKLVFLSLINPNKNLHLIINAVNKWQDKFILDIYGPQSDKNYWRECLELMKDNDLIQYKGAVLPWDVQPILQGYHFFVLPTQGENFGHAIFDSLSAGVPVLISRNNPWKDIDKKKAGFYIDLSDNKSTEAILHTLTLISASGYAEYRVQSLMYAKDFIDSKDYKSEYQFLLH